MLEPWLLQGLTYDQACAKAGLDFRAHTNTQKTAKLPASAQELEDITSPVVRRAVSQTIKVVNAIIRDMDRGVTLLHGEGGWSGTDKKILLVAVRKHLYPSLRDIVREEDPAAFMIVGAAKEVYGLGFRSHHDEL